MEAQNYTNHTRTVPMYHVVLAFLLGAAFLGSLVNLYLSCSSCGSMMNASLITVLSICGVIQYWYSRVFALTAQDRAIRAEENLRHFVMTGKLLDPKLTIRQIIALRFASDEEFLALAKRAVDENLSRDDIKKAIKNWRADYHRA